MNEYEVLLEILKTVQRIANSLENGVDPNIQPKEQDPATFIKCGITRRPCTNLKGSCSTCKDWSKPMEKGQDNA